MARIRFAAFMLLSFTVVVLFPGRLFAADPRLDVLNAMSEELARASKNLSFDDYQAPYFLSYQLKSHHTHAIVARYGAIYRDSDSKSADLSVQVRVGDYSFDNTGKLQDYFPFSMKEGIPVSSAAPIDNGLTALRTSLWMLTDSDYREALNQYMQKRGDAVYERPDRSVASFSREKPQHAILPQVPFDFDRARFRTRMIELSRVFEAHPEILQSQVKLSAEKQVRYYVNSEGSRIVDERVLYTISAEAEARALDDTVLTNSRSFYAPSAEDLPPLEQMKLEIGDMIAELVSLRVAPELDPYSGPAILSARATGVLFHEVIGHRLEGERQNSDEEGRTYKGQIGQPILPEFLSLVDDPTLATLSGEHLNGTYAYDDEGVKAQRVELVENGVLKTFLMSRTPVEGVGHSNGHGRATGGRKPMARMGNLILSSKKTVSDAELKKRLIELVIAQKKPYGLIIEDMEGGSTNTSTYGYQAFKGVPRVVWRVFPDGREELVRGVEMVGTPLSSINKIVMTSDKMQVFNGFCGAESGWVPVSSAAPAVLLDELELQRKKADKVRPPVLESPFNGEARGK